MKNLCSILNFVLAVCLINVGCSPEMHLSETEKKIQRLENQCRTNPENLDTVVALARLYQFNGAPEKAIAILKNPISRHPENAEVAIWYANAESIMAGNAEKVQDKVSWSQRAIGDIDEIVEKFHDHWMVHYIRGVNSMQWPEIFHRKPVAIEDFSYLLAMKEKNPACFPDSLLPDIHYRLGRAYLDSGIDPRKGKDHLLLVLSRYPSSAEAQLIRKNANQ